MALHGFSQSTVSILRINVVRRWQDDEVVSVRSRTAGVMRPLFAPHSGGWSPRGIERRTAAAGEVSLAHTTSRPQTVQGRGGGAGQQDGAHRLGIAGQGRHLSGAGLLTSLPQAQARDAASASMPTRQGGSALKNASRQCRAAQDSARRSPRSAPSAAPSWRA